jgi:hypothetical protein
MPAHSASKTRVNALMAAGIHVFYASKEDVDGRDKPGHDEKTLLQQPFLTTPQHA